MTRTVQPLELEGAALYKALSPHHRDNHVAGAEIVTVDDAKSTTDQPYIRVVRKTNDPAPIIGPASEGLLDTSRWRLVPLTGRNKAEREIHAKLLDLARERAERKRERLATFRARQREIDRDGPAIVRSPGIPIPGTPYAAGGGYQGRTDDLDGTVRQAAEMLLQAFGQDVTIRFNSDRESGGAFVVTDAVNDIGANAEIGLGAVLIDIPKRRQRARRRRDDTEVDRDIRALLEADGYDPDNPPERYVKVKANIGERALLHPEVATEHHYKTGSPRVYATFGSLDAGLAFLQAHARDPREIDPLA